MEAEKVDCPLQGRGSSIDLPRGWSGLQLNCSTLSRKAMLYHDNTLCQPLAEAAVHREQSQMSAAKASLARNAPVRPAGGMQHNVVEMLQRRLLRREGSKIKFHNICNKRKLVRTVESHKQ